MITGEYKIKISKYDDWYLADVCFPDGMKSMTQGKTEEDILEMIADLIMTVKDVPVSRWSRFFHKLLRLK